MSHFGYCYFIFVFYNFVVKSQQPRCKHDFDSLLAGINVTRKLMSASRISADELKGMIIKNERKQSYPHGKTGHLYR